MPRNGITWIAIFIVIGLMFLRLPQMVAKQDAVVRTYGALVEVDALTKQKYVEPIADNRLVEGAIRGMLLQLDPYSGYVSPDELPAHMRKNHGDYIGIGIATGVRNHRLTVIAPIEGSPASRADIRPGDWIVSIDGVVMKDASVVDAERLLVGRPGTSVRLRIERPGDPPVKAIVIPRGPVSLRTVYGIACRPDGTPGFVIDPDAKIGYVRISNFRDNTLRDFDRAMTALRDNGVRGLVLDLRANPGGALNEAVGLVDRFVSEGLILSTVTRRRAVRQYFATEAGTASDIELVILIDHATASAAEIVAGSLQSLHRAVVVGRRSFGKGSIQELIRLTEHGGAIRLTTAYYRLPDGRFIHRTSRNEHTDAWGVIPDIMVPPSSDLAEPAATRQEPDAYLVAADAQLAEALRELRRRLAALRPIED